MSDLKLPETPGKQSLNLVVQTIMLPDQGETRKLRQEMPTNIEYEEDFSLISKDKPIADYGTTACELLRQEAALRCSNVPL